MRIHGNPWERCALEIWTITWSRNGDNPFGSLRTSKLVQSSSLTRRGFVARWSIPFSGPILAISFGWHGETSRCHHGFWFISFSLQLGTFFAIQPDDIPIRFTSFSDVFPLDAACLMKYHPLICWYGGFLKWAYPQIIHSYWFSNVFHVFFHVFPYKPSIWGYPHDYGKLHPSAAVRAWTPGPFSVIVGVPTWAGALSGPHGPLSPILW